MDLRIDLRPSFACAVPSSRIVVDLLGYVPGTTGMQGMDGRETKALSVCTSFVFPCLPRVSDIMYFLRPYYIRLHYLLSTD